MVISGFRVERIPCLFRYPAIEPISHFFDFYVTYVGKVDSHQTKQIVVKKTKTMQVDQPDPRCGLALSSWNKTFYFIFAIVDRFSLHAPNASFLV